MPVYSQLEWQFQTLSGEDLARFSGLGGEYWSEFRSPLKGLRFRSRVTVVCGLGWTQRKPSEPGLFWNIVVIWGRSVHTVR